ncbi:MAG: ECF transporter S component [Clostridium butyricum]|nr:ECF transporter S component [Clostridium butyricum]
MEKTSRMIKISLLSAIAVILMYIDVPVIPLFPWLKMDLSDVPALMGAFGFGPIAGVVIELLKNVLYFLIKGSGTGIVGETANFLIGSSLILPAGIIYHRNKNKKNAILGMILGAISIQLVGILANVYFLLPAYGIQMSQSETLKYITVGLLPLNGAKALIVSVITYFLYKRVSVSIFKSEPNFGSPEREAIK